MFDYRALYEIQLQVSVDFLGSCNLFTSNGTVSTKINDKRNDFESDIVNFQLLDGVVPP